MKKNYILLVLIFSVVSLKLSGQVPASWTVTGIGGGGALFAPTINPANSNEWYVACDMSEQFHTKDFGLTYDIVDFRQLQAFHNSTVRCTSNPNLRFSINYANNQIVPVKSTDGGKTWTTLAGNPDNTEETYGIWVDFNDPTRMIISYYGAIYFSSNGGTTFTNIHNALNNGAGIVIGGVFFLGVDIYIGTNDGLIASSNSGVSFSTLTTTGIPSTEAINSFAAAKQGGTLRFFALTGDINNIYAGQVGSDYYQFTKGVYTMDNNNGTWTKRMTGINVSADYLMYIGMAENDVSTAYVGGSSSAGAPNIMKTTDGGLTWTHTFNTASNQNIVTGWCGIGGDHNYGWPECLFGMAVAASNKNVLIFTDYSDVMKTNDGGATWRQAYVSPADENPAGSNTPAKKYYHSIGLENTASWYLHWTSASDLFAAFTDIFAIRSKDGGNSWAFDYTAPSTNTVYCVTKNIAGSTLYAATSSRHDLYKSYILTDAVIDSYTGKVIFSNDNGATWAQLHDFLHPVYWLAMDPNNSERMYAAVVNYAQGVGGIWVTNNLSAGAASTWTHLSNPPRTEGHPATMTVLNNGKLLCSFSGRRASNMFTNSSGIFLYDPGTGIWTDKSDAGQHYWCHDVIVDPNDATQNTWYSGVYSGYGGNGNGMGGLYKTTNGGTSWARIFNNGDVSSCTFNPNNANELFVTTHGNGLWYSANINNVSPSFTQVASYTFGSPERVFFNPFDQTKIWISSFGHGLQWGDITNTGMVSSINNVNPLSVYPNPASGSVHFNFEQPITNGVLKIYNSQGREVFHSMVNNTVQVDVVTEKFTAGIYYYWFVSDGNSESGKFSVIK